MLLFPRVRKAPVRQWTAGPEVEVLAPLRPHLGHPRRWLSRR